MAKQGDINLKTGSGKGNHRGLMRGRPTSESKDLRRQITQECEKEICKHLPQLIKNMIRLADGGYEREELEYFSDDDGCLVLGKRKTSIAEPDRFANQYLIDRIMGKCSQVVAIGKGPGYLDASQMFVIPPVDDRPEPESES